MSADQDVHGGATAAQLRAALTTAFTAVTIQCERLELRPSSVAASSLFGLLSLSVELPGEDTAGVDALAGVYGLGPDDGGGQAIYSRRGEVELEVAGFGVRVHLMVFTSRPKRPAAVAVAAATSAEEPPTNEVAAVPQPVRIQSERALAVAR